MRTTRNCGTAAYRGNVDALDAIALSKQSDRQVRSSNGPLLAVRKTPSTSPGFTSFHSRWSRTNTLRVPRSTS